MCTIDGLCRADLSLQSAPPFEHRAPRHGRCIEPVAAAKPSGIGRSIRTRTSCVAGGNARNAFPEGVGGDAARRIAHEGGNLRFGILYFRRQCSSAHDIVRTDENIFDLYDSGAPAAYAQWCEGAAVAVMTPCGAAGDGGGEVLPCGVPDNRQPTTRYDIHRSSPSAPSCAGGRGTSSRAHTSTEFGGREHLPRSSVQATNLHRIGHNGREVVHTVDMCS